MTPSQIEFEAVGREARLRLCAYIAIIALMVVPGWWAPTWFGELFETEALR